MHVKILDGPALSAISPLAISYYLNNLGWKRIGGFADRGDIYLSPNQNSEIIVPRNTNFADYSKSVSQIIEILSQFEEIDEFAVLRDLAAADVDLIRIRAPAAEDDGSIEIEVGVELIRQSRDLLLAAACSVVRPQKVYRAGKIREATDYLSDVRLGQTERGSFVVTLLSPVPPELVEPKQPGLWPEFSDEPFGRKATRRLIEALSETRLALNEVVGGKGIAAFESRVPKGVSSNLCFAASCLIDKGVGLDVSVSWALTRHAPTNRSKVQFKKDDAEILQEAAKVLREREARSDEQIVGYVTNLARGKEASEGHVIIKAPIDDRMCSVKVEFGPENYSEVVAAHDKRKLVQLDGDLEREGQRWKLTNPRHLSILADEDDEQELQ